MPAGALPTEVTRFHRRLILERLSLAHVEPQRRLVQTLADARVDLNPHQIEAASFALAALEQGGCVLADEVGLGKTIEAGLVVAQFCAEKKRRILILCPATLRAQWQAELADKFGIPAQIIDGRSRGRGRSLFGQDGVVVLSLPFAAQNADELVSIAWDLVVIDEAHRLRNAYRRSHKTGTTLRAALFGRPKLLLTATPLQNNLLEMFGLLTLVDEQVLGPEEAFRLRFQPDPATRILSDEAGQDLRARLSPVLHRTLRRQVKEYVRFTQRRSLVEDFALSPKEQELYEKVTHYLRRPDTAGLPASKRPLLALVFHKLLASSTRALAPSLAALARSLGARADAESRETALGLDLAPWAEEAEEWDGDPDDRPSPMALRAEVDELDALASLAESIDKNAKAEALCRALDRIFTVARANGWPQKVVIFTEFRRTQVYLHELLSRYGHEGQISLLSGEAQTPEQRRRLIQEFRDRTRILISTEAGAEGLNLQFCNLVINYDLPWNPQRLEQRIGRCHRYGQERDVLVLNLLNRENAADRRLYELLEKKLFLFDGVFGASDEILGALAGGLDFERRVLRIYQSCRSPEEIDRAFDDLRSDLEGAIDDRLAKARALLFERFDAEVRSRFRLTQDTVRRQLEARRADLAAVGAPERRAAPAAEPEPVAYLTLDGSALPERLRHLLCCEGWWFAFRFDLSGLGREEELVHLVLIRQGDRFVSLPLEDAQCLPGLPGKVELSRRPPSVAVIEAEERALESVQAELVARFKARVAASQDSFRERWDRYAEDCLWIPRQEHERARREWERARAALARADSEAKRLLARADLFRCEREYRKKLSALRQEEETRYAARDRAQVPLEKHAQVEVRRRLVASAYFWLE